ncbi:MULTISPECIES: biotin transporter BioY [Streptomyces]|uniref:Biotin transporter n=2 Tax=Streptomyces TaxID=1883 RepID=A0A420V8U2_9ACTN|nr:MULTISPECIES: biotin transporter BioY [Streptomyces]KNE84019.1 biotin biosynthesis protein BioY [Streptomyces fradiae]OFA60633.1 biotin biosynthesis protein BioY [Streptomyces fradiae]PQM24704.1 biotin transporter BioY [Streptomyces xinghaiensis]RKM98757.1 biotin transporter BioY [Streptomyces xinghaiensis]RNC76343.1 biotin transporter BioY [Streptomyces xinghaiensis]
MSTAAVTRTHRPGAVLADLLPAATATRARLRDAALVVGGAALTGAAAQLVVPVPGSPVPVTGQTFAALLVGASLGAGRGFLSLALYTLVGMAGMPWFAGGAGSATFGYVLGMLLAATVVGALARRGGDRGLLRTAGTMALGSLIIYAVGVPYLALAVDLSFGEALAVGMVPFLIGDALKAALAMGALPAAWKLAGRRG